MSEWLQHHQNHQYTWKSPGDSNMNRRPATSNTSNGDEMLPKTPQHIVHRTHNKCGGTQQNRACHWTIRRLAYYCQKKKAKMVWPRSSGLSKTIMQGTVKGGRRRGGQRKRWEDNIKDWTCLRAAESLRVSKDRNGWREVVRRSVMAPLRPPEVMG